MIRNLGIYSFLVLALTTCISPLEYEPDESENVIVVNGYITDQPGPHFVEISRIAPFKRITQGGYIEPIEEAEVRLLDQNGSNIALFEDRPGRYATPSFFSGIAGRQYQLEISTKEGVFIESQVEELITGPEIDTVFTRFKLLPTSDEFGFRSGLEVISQWKDPAGERNFHMWTRQRGIYKIRTAPPPPGPPCCAVCWIMDIQEQIRVHEDLRQDGEVISETALFIEDDGKRFRIRYWIDLEQLTLSAEAYEFYRILKSQLDISGSIFDPPPAEIKGNLYSTDESLTVIGHFGAFGAQRKSIFLDRELVEQRQNEPILRIHCQNLDHSSTEEPDFWEDE